MGEGFVHYLTPTGLESWRKSASGITCLAHHPDTADGRRAFGEWLDAHGKYRHALIVGLREEEFHVLPTPRLNGREAKTLLRSRLRQHFPDTPFATGYTASRNRGETRLILTAIATPSSLQAWAELLQTREATLTSIRSPALLLRHMLSALKVKSEAGLLVYASSAGQHHVYFEDEQPHFARLVLAPATTDRQILHAEIERTLQYLDSRKIRDGRRALDLILLDAVPGDAPAVPASALTNVRLQHIRIPGPAPRSDERHDCTAFLLELAARQSRGPQFAPPALLRRHRLQGARAAFLLLGTISCVLLSALALTNFRQASLLLPGVEASRQTLASLRTEHSRLQDEFARLSMDASSLRELGRQVDVAEALANRRNASLLRLSRALDLNPRIDLDALAWQTSSSPDAAGKPIVILTIAGSVREPMSHGDTLASFRRTLASLDFELTAHGGQASTTAMASSPADLPVIQRFSWQLSMLAPEQP